VVLLEPSFVARYAVWLVLPVLQSFRQPLFMAAMSWQLLRPKVPAAILGS